MKNYFTKTVIVMSKYMLIGIFFQCLFLNLLFADNSLAQRKSMNDIKLSIRVDGNILDLFEQIERATDFRFSYHSAFFDKTQIIHYNARNQSLTQILEWVSRKADLKFKRINESIHVLQMENEGDRVEEIAAAPAQSVSVSGKVTAADSPEGLPGVNVILKNTTVGTVTDLNGNYRLSVPGDGILVFSSVGYVSEEIPVNNRSVIDLNLEPDVTALQEIVVIGYGEVEKRDVTGAIGSVQSQDIVRANPVLPAKALQGQVAGVNVNKVNSRPGAEYNIDIRGLSSIDKSNAPLVVIDGVMGGNLNTLNPSDIASMDVLKDASATAIYGSRGANGVIIITTKRGTEGKPQIAYDGYVGVKTPAHLPEMMNAQQFYKAYNDDRLLDGGRAANFTSSELAMIESGRSTDWVDEVTDPGIQTSHAVSVSGGNSNTVFHFSTSYLKEEGNLKETNFDRFNIKGSMDSRINDVVKVGFNAYYTYSIQNLGSNEALRGAYRARPTGSVYYNDLVNPAENNDLDFKGYAVWMGINDKQTLSPIVEVDPDNFQDETRVSSLLANGFVELTPLKNLSFRSSISAAVYNSRRGEFRGKFTKSQRTTRNPRADYFNNQNTSYTLDNILTYKVEAARHRVTFTAVQSALAERFEKASTSVQDLPFNSGWYALGTAATINGVDSRLEEKTLLSYMGRVNYSFNDKYLLTLTGRWDGSSVLAEGNKWAFFPSAAFAWRLDAEPFIQNLNLFSDLKFRVSYGVVGNDVVGPYGTQATLLNTAYDFDGSPAFGFAPAVIANSELGWEKSREINLGLNLGFFQNRLSAIVELYRRNTVDLILNQKLPTSTGFGEVTSNVGEVLNQGLEITLNTVNFRSENFSWSTSINFSTNHNEILELYGGDNKVDKGNKLFVGESLRSNFYFQFDGIWQLDEADEATKYKQVPGAVKVVDQNNDGKISTADGEDDRVVLGSELPKWLGGMTNRFTYRNFDFSFFVYTRQGAQFRSQLLSGTFGELGSDRYNRLNLNYWTSENPTNDYFGVVAANPYREAIQYQKANFVRISDITLGYTLPRALLDKLKFSNFRVYGQVSNPFVFSDFIALDPEFNSNVYQDDVPFASYLFGVNLSF